MPLCRALNKSPFEEASLFKELLSFCVCVFFVLFRLFYPPKGQAFPAPVISWGLSRCPLVPAPEVTAEAQNCKRVSLVPALGASQKKNKNIAGNRRTGRAPSGLVSPRHLLKAGRRIADSLVPACLCSWEQGESQLGPGRRGLCRAAVC